ncbi:aspartyl-tRNA(Asn)/glutamyl-tRNA(Gln) amidotransferase subunit C [Metamycoplasma subdolum]|uniref:Aspartyl-tRNA(Asn)/glutamyl-tRNA(Gln) amidotransferase subunit C n=1 Tax=Metamycoplasma subdolum TaxID=92407 RepID=A0A3M0A212_9BACT|nr:Asp-tRNA(Asn)/Glu-tRNA(Gln) amidotransferase subunit GatC [Metamycoplasma subdolum]RMA77479.1 aspartyl-tRNA(Asn)/glutamyl-tRNA(Gln) amidotransferase subunit C [Metamycoplasma subdolum]WPB50678.1 Asp-tRNA(Asn)/Glu-tRNA(Gln) amidotransferase subunit GatC [Metamycoplasma subdolum]
MNDEKFKKLANDLLFEPSDEIIKMAKKLLSSIDKELKKLDEINLDNVKPMSHISEKKLSFDLLRDDVENKEFLIKKEDLLANTSKHNDDFVLIKKVINEA